MTRWESDQLVVLRKRESRLQGEEADVYVANKGNTDRA
jgi:hypothetical protein